MGLAVFLLGGAGLGWAVWRREPGSLVLAGFVVVFFAEMGTLRAGASGGLRAPPRI
jgi:hypothetical protein